MSGKSSDPVEESTSDVKAVFNTDTGVTSNYYGSTSEGDGPGHGHADVTSDGDVTFNREPNTGN